jgi:hypothetical protein
MANGAQRVTADQVLSASCLRTLIYSLWYNRALLQSFIIGEESNTLRLPKSAEYLLSVPFSVSFIKHAFR